MNFSGGVIKGRNAVLPFRCCLFAIAGIARGMSRVPPFRMPFYMGPEMLISCLVDTMQVRNEITMMEIGRSRPISVSCSSVLSYGRRDASL